MKPLNSSASRAYNPHRLPSTYRKGASLLRALALVTLASCGSKTEETIVQGETQTFGSAQMSTWAKLDSNGLVLEAGAVIPMSIIRDMPAPGDGPGGAIAALKYPAAVVATTFFNTMVAQSNMTGHPGPYYAAPHFDFHFYQVPKATVLTYVPSIDEHTCADPLSQPPNVVSLPSNYVMESTCVAYMGTHAITNEDAAAMAGTKLFSKSMIQGYYGGKVIFVEPMVTQELMLTKQSFSLPVPMPAHFGLAAPTLYPTEFRADYDSAKDAYIFTFSRFITVQ